MKSILYDNKIYKISEADYKKFCKVVSKWNGGIEEAIEILLKKEGQELGIDYNLDSTIAQDEGASNPYC